jgi:hypothetical protein
MKAGVPLLSFRPCTGQVECQIANTSRNSRVCPPRPCCAYCMISRSREIFTGWQPGADPDASGQRTSPRCATIYDMVSPTPPPPTPPVQRPARHAGSPGTARLLGPRRRPAPARPARPAHRHPRHLVQRWQRHRTPAPGAPDPAGRPLLLRRTIPPPRRIPDPSGWFEVFETDDPDQLHAFPRATSRASAVGQIQLQLSESL